MPAERSERSERVLLIHYTAPPVVGGVEAVLEAQAGVILRSGMGLAVAAGEGNAAALAPGAELILIPEMDSQHPEIVDISRALEDGKVPPAFERMTAHLEAQLGPLASGFQAVIVHNVLTKHFNLPLTAALVRLVEEGQIQRCIAWCHDFTWSSPHSRAKVHPGYPWDLLRTPVKGVRYVTISAARQKELAEVLVVPEERIQVIYNGVDPGALLGIGAAGLELADRLALWQADPYLLMPVRVTQAKNIELAMRVAAALCEAGRTPKVVITGPPDPHDPQNMEYFQGLLHLRRELGVEREVCFVYEYGLSANMPLTLSQNQVGELMRLADLVFLPSHREGFGMPVLEAGLVGAPVVCSEHVPAALEIGGQEVSVFSENTSPEQVARLILDQLAASPIARMRRHVRRDLTWQAIFERQLRPLLEDGG